MQTMKFAGLGALAVVMLVVVASAQEGNITVSGNVTDAAGAYVSGAVITVNIKQCKCADCKNPVRCDCCPNQLRVQSNEEGHYSFTVFHGVYHVDANARGQRAEFTLDLNEGSTKNFDIRLSQDVSRGMMNVRFLPYASIRYRQGKNTGVGDSQR